MAKSKAEIDKEIMYAKSMPSSTRSQPVHTEVPSSVSNTDSVPSPLPQVWPMHCAAPSPHLYRCGKIRIPYL